MSVGLSEDSAKQCDVWHHQHQHVSAAAPPAGSHRTLNKLRVKKCRRATFQQWIEPCFYFSSHQVLTDIPSGSFQSIKTLSDSQTVSKVHRIQKSSQTVFFPSEDLWDRDRMFSLSVCVCVCVCFPCSICLLQTTSCRIIIGRNISKTRCPALTAGWVQVNTKWNNLKVVWLI